MFWVSDGTSNKKFEDLLKIPVLFIEGGCLDRLYLFNVLAKLHIAELPKSDNKPKYFENVGLMQKRKQRIHSYTRNSIRYP